MSLLFLSRRLFWSSTFLSLLVNIVFEVKVYNRQVCHPALSSFDQGNRPRLLDIHKNNHLSQSLSSSSLTCPLSLSLILCICIRIRIYKPHKHTYTYTDFDLVAVPVITVQLTSLKTLKLVNVVSNNPKQTPCLWWRSTTLAAPNASFQTANHGYQLACYRNGGRLYTRSPRF